MNKIILKKSTKQTIKIALSLTALTILTLLEIALFSAAIIALIYAFVLAAAWHSAMAFCLLFGACWIFIGLGLFCVHTFCKQLKFFKYRYVKTSKYYQNSELISTDKNGKLVATDAKSKNTDMNFAKNKNIDNAAAPLNDTQTTLNDTKNDASTAACCKNKPKSHVSAKRRALAKKIFTTSNIACVMIILGALFAVISAIEKSTTRQAWAEARYDYMYENGYYNTTKIYNISFPVKVEAAEGDAAVTVVKEEITKLTIDLECKNAVVIYTDVSDKFVGIHDNTLIQIHSFITYVDQLTVTKSADGSELILKEHPSKLLNRTSEKMLFFLFTENEAEKQIRIFIPLALKEQIAITGKFVVAQ